MKKFVAILLCFLYHNDTSNSGQRFSRDKAEQFDAPNRLIIEPGEEIPIK